VTLTRTAGASDPVAVAAGAAGVLGNITVVAPSGGVALTVFGEGAATPSTSNINAAVGQIVANNFTSKIGTSNSISILCSGGATNFVIDIFDEQAQRLGHDEARRARGAPGPAQSPVRSQHNEQQCKQRQTMRGALAAQPAFLCVCGQLPGRRRAYCQVEARGRFRERRAGSRSQEGCGWERHGAGCHGCCSAQERS
jgi:hypothetical protein